VVIASKFGLEATVLARMLRPVKPFVRLQRGKRGSSAPKNGIPGHSSGSKGPFLRRLPVTAAAMERSLEQSLQALGTDYLDIFLLHEPDWIGLPLEEIARSADKLKKQGKVKAFGAAFYRGQESMADLGHGVFDLLQFDCPPPGEEYDTIKEERGQRANVIFSPSRAAVDGRLRPDVLTRLWADFPRSVVLSSMFNPDHIRVNAAKAV
jgi:aryl-alcohol dehydrogenase-like predicted oxidoreductase